MSRLGRLRTRVGREDSGFTLIELMVSAAIGTVILLVAYSLLDSSVRAFGSSEARTEVAQRGRLAMDLVTQRLRSPVCTEGSANDAAFISGTGTAVRFLSDLTDGARDPVTGLLAPLTDREIVLNGSTLTENTRVNGVNRSRVLATGVAPIDSSTPVFSYFALTARPQGSAQGLRSATVALGAGSSVAAADLKRVARVKVAFRVDPRNAQDSRSAAEFTSDVYVRSINPSSDEGQINCIAG
jgi:prepilin-type N-terminal cleavage/methylation domain-containing protein